MTNDIYVKTNRLFKKKIVKFTNIMIILSPLTNYFILSYKTNKDYITKCFRG